MSKRKVEQELPVLTIIDGKDNIRRQFVPIVYVETTLQGIQLDTLRFKAGEKTLDDVISHIDQLLKDLEIKWRGND